MNGKAAHSVYVKRTTRRTPPTVLAPGSRARTIDGRFHQGGPRLLAADANILRTAEKTGSRTLRYARLNGRARASFDEGPRRESGHAAASRSPDGDEGEGGRGPAD